jgi:hypothetical protein
LIKAVGSRRSTYKVRKARADNAKTVRSVTDEYM